MTFRTVTLTAVAALSLGMAASQSQAQTQTVTVPLNAPGTAAPAQTGPGTVVTRGSDGVTTVDTVGGVPADEVAAPAGATPQGDASQETPGALGGVAATGPGAAPAPGSIADPQASSADTLDPSASAMSPSSMTGSATVESGAGNVVSGTTDATAVGDVTSTGAPARLPQQPNVTEDATTEPSAEVTGTDISDTESAARPTAEGETPAPQLSQEEATEAARTGTAAPDGAPATPTPTGSPGEPPAAPKEGLPASATEEQVTAPVPVGTEAGEPAPGEAPVAGAAPEGAADGVGDTPPDEQVPAAAPEGGEDAHAAEAAPAAAHHAHVEDVDFSFEGPFGRFDQFQLQRGLQVYTEVCSACHGMKQVAIRSLADEGGPGLPENQVRAYAAQMTIMDPETGEERPRLPTDHFPTVTGLGMGPDLSLMAKARAGFHGPYGTGISQLVNGMGGPEYIHAILTGYTGEQKEEAGSVLYENTAFASGWIAMPPPLQADQVAFADGAPSDVDSMSMDVTAFLMWAAEPHLMDRKQVGFVSVLFLIALTVLLYLTNQRLWWPLKHRADRLNDGR